MPGSIQIELDEQSTQEVRDIAETLQQSPEQVAKEVVLNGMHALRRYADLKRRSETVNVGEVIEMLRSSKSDNPPDPGDEIPEDLREWVDERRSKFYASIAPE